MDCINSLLQAASAEHFFSNYDAVSSQVGNMASTTYQNARSPCEDVNAMSQTVPNVEDVNSYGDAMPFPDDLSAFGKFRVVYNGLSWRPRRQLLPRLQL